MDAKKIWEFPVPSTVAISTKLIYPGGDAWFLFDYYDEGKNDEIFNSGIRFEAVQAYRHSCEKFTASLMDAYDYLVEIEDSEWIDQLREIDKQIADYWNIKHYAIFLDSNGLFEFIARGHEVLDTKKGPLE